METFYNIITHIRLTNSEIAALFYLVLFLAYSVVKNRNIIPIFLRLLKQLIKLWYAWLIQIIYIFYMLYILYQKNIIDINNSKMIISWCLIAVSMNKYIISEKNIFTILKSFFAFTLVIEFILQHSPFPIWVEFCLVPIQTIITILYFVSISDSYKREKNYDKKVTSLVSTFLGLLLLIFLGIRIIFSYRYLVGQFSIELVYEFIKDTGLSFILTILYIPLILLFKLYAKINQDYTRKCFFDQKLKDGKIDKETYDNIVNRKRLS